MQVHDKHVFGGNNEIFLNLFKFNRQFKLLTLLLFFVFDIVAADAAAASF